MPWCKNCGQAYLSNTIHSCAAGPPSLSNISTPPAEPCALIAAYDEYVAELEAAEGSLLGLAHAHGFRTSPERIERGKQLRARIAELKATHPIAPVSESELVEALEKIAKPIPDMGNHMELARRVDIARAILARFGSRL